MKLQSDESTGEGLDLMPTIGAGCGSTAGTARAAFRQTPAWAAEQAMIEREVAQLSECGRLLASRMIERIVEIERVAGPDVAEAVVDRLVDICRGRRRVLS
jgi:hypothetical protein